MKVQINSQMFRTAKSSSKQVLVNATDYLQPIFKATADFFKNKDTLKGIGVGGVAAGLISGITQHISNKKQHENDNLIKKAIIKQDAEIKEVKSDNDRLNQINEKLQEALINANGVNSDEKEKCN